MTLLYLIIILFFCGVLIKSADIVVISIKRISTKAKASTFWISATILPLGTSLPELFVGITSALENSANLSLGVIVGSNIANMALIGSVAAIMAGRVRVFGDFLKKDFFVAFFAGIIPMLLVIDGELSRVDALILMMVYFAYATGFFKKRYQEIGEEQGEDVMRFRFLRTISGFGSGQAREFGKLFIGVAMLLFSSNVIVKLSTELATSFGVPLFVVGLFFIAFGTSLPELAFATRSLKEREPSMFFGNILGSIIANSTLVIGSTALIQPIQLMAINEYFTAAIMFVVTFILFYLFTKSKHRLDRWEAFFMLGLYALFVLLEFKVISL